MNFFAGALSEDNGNPSFTRIGLMLVLLALLVPKVALAIHSQAEIVFTPQDSLVLTLVFGSKIGSKLTEKR